MFQTLKAFIAQHNVEKGEQKYKCGNAYCASVSGINMNIKIDGAYLISAEEYEAIIANVPGVPVDLGHWYWTRTPANNGHVVVVHRDGTLFREGFSPRFGHGGVRPVFLVSGVQNMTPGTKINIGNLACTVVGKDCVFSDKIIDIKPFDSVGNNIYFESDIAKYLFSISNELEKITKQGG